MDDYHIIAISFASLTGLIGVHSFYKLDQLDIEMNFGKIDILEYSFENKIKILLKKLKNEKKKYKRRIENIIAHKVIEQKIENSYLFGEITRIDISDIS